MKFHNIEQNTAEWYELRKGKFTASCFKDLFSKETTATYRNALYKVVFERITGDTPEYYEGYWMNRGTELEPFARQAYEMETFNKVHNGGFFELNEWIGCSPDGLIGDEGLLEAKCPKYSTIIEYMLSGELPSIYFWQVQGQLYVTGRKWCDFIAYHPNLKPIIIRVERDEVNIQKLEECLNLSISKAKKIIQKLT